jgi:hypothetical protein
MRLLGFGEGIDLCVFIAVQQFCVGEEVLFDVNWCFSSTTIVSPRSVSIVAHQSPEWQHRLVTKTAGEDAPFTREIVALRTLPQSGFVQQPITLVMLSACIQTGRTLARTEQAAQDETGGKPRPEAGSYPLSSRAIPPPRKQVVPHRRCDRKSLAENLLRFGFWIRRWLATGLWLGRNRRECSTAQAALQIVEVETQQIEGMMNESAMRTCPCRHGNVVVTFAGHHCLLSGVTRR